MINFRLITSSLFFTAIASISVLAQIQPSPKIVLLNTEAFSDAKLGITKLVNANKQLEAEFTARVKELQDGTAKLQIISRDLGNMRSLPANQFNQVAFSTKQEEGERLQRELNYKKTELESAVAKRRETLITPISRDIGKGIDEFSKKNGYGAIFDVAKLAETGVLLFLASSVDVTKEFIAFYNARPASTATTATPR